jgi:hypothetical protein
MDEDSKLRKREKKKRKKEKKERRKEGKNLGAAQCGKGAALWVPRI